MIKKILRLLPDKLYLKIYFYKKMHKKLNLDNPKTFNEKLQWLKLYDRKDIYTKMVDKYEVKDYVASIIGKEYIIPTLGVYNSFDEIDFDKLPNQFVIKCTHDSGGLVIVKDKSKLDINKARNKINKSLKNNYFYAGREWPYKNVKPRIIIEEYLSELKDDIIDYKFMVFNGKVEYVFTCTDRNTSGLKVTFFDKSFNRLNFKRHYDTSSKEILKPINYEKMVELSEKLSNNIPFIRVDFYNIDGKIYFGELTFYPGSGVEEFTPEIWDKKLGDLIKLPGDKNEK